MHNPFPQGEKIFLGRIHAKVSIAFFLKSRRERNSFSEKKSLAIRILIL
jgi:hypothetical protein